MEHRIEACEQARASLGGRHAARRSVEQPDAQFPLQTDDRVAQRGAGNAHDFGRPAKTAVVCHCREGGQIAQARTDHS